MTTKASFSKLLSQFMAPPRTSKTHVFPDLCKCSNCGLTFKIADCPTAYGPHDGWEMPAYTAILCPACEDGGCIDDFFFSGENNG